MDAKKDRTLAAGAFKATCLAVLDEVAASGRGVIITKRGKPVARLIPVSMLEAKPLAGSVLYEDDIISPVSVEWHATR